VLPLLKPLGENRYGGTTFDLALAPSTQFQNVESWRAGKQQRIPYQGSTDEVFTARVGSADLLLNWDNLRDRAQGRARPPCRDFSADRSALGSGDDRWGADDQRPHRHFAPYAGGSADRRHAAEARTDHRRRGVAGAQRGRDRATASALVCSTPCCPWCWPM
jgi:hypothetical protein